MPAQKNPLGSTGETVAANVARLRLSAGLTYVELERLLTDSGRKIPVLGLSHVEQGKRRVDADDLVSLAAVLGVNPNTLLLPAEVEPEGDEPTEATATGAATARQLWAWGDGWEPLPSQRPKRAAGLSAVARGRAMWEERHGFANRSRPAGDDRDLYDFLRRLRQLAADAAQHDDRITLWSADGYQVAGYPPASTEARDMAGALVEQLRADVLSILRSPAVAPLRQSILAELESDADASRGDN